MDRQKIHNEIIKHLKSLMNEKPDAYTTGAMTFDRLNNNFQRQLTFKDEDIVREELHLLVLNNVLMIAGPRNSFENSVLYRLTEYGKKCLTQEDYVPMDPNGYLDSFSQDISNIDSIILEYLEESITAYNRNLILSSVITLGVASERAILLVIDSFCQFIVGSILDKNIHKLKEERAIYNKYELFKKVLNAMTQEQKKKFPRDYDITIDTIFNFIRKNRNEKGHPKDVTKDRTLQLTNLQAFKSYLKTVYELKVYFDSEKLEDHIPKTK